MNVVVPGSREANHEPTACEPHERETLTTAELADCECPDFCEDATTTATERALLLEGPRM